MPARPAASRLRSVDPSAGQHIPDPEPAPEPAPAPTPAPKRRPAPKEPTVRQTLDLPASDHDQLHAEVRAYAREHGLHPRDLNVQTVLRVLVRRVLADDQGAELRRETLDEARQDAIATRDARAK